MTTIRAKFYVSGLDPKESAEAQRVTLNAVCRGVENAIWSQATPAGSIEMYVKNGPAFEAFEQGAEYEVTFRKVAKPMPGDCHDIKPVENMHGYIVCETCGANLHAAREDETKPWTKGHAEGSETHQRNLAMHKEIYGPQDS